jgi:hypothetical protein
MSEVKKYLYIGTEEVRIKSWICKAQIWQVADTNIINLIIT